MVVFNVSPISWECPLYLGTIHLISKQSKYIYIYLNLFYGLSHSIDPIGVYLGIFGLYISLSELVIWDRIKKLSKATDVPVPTSPMYNTYRTYENIKNY